MSRESRLSEPHVLLFISAVPPFAYWLTYLFQYGFCKHYGIPSNFIDISLVNVLVCGFGFAVFFHFLSSLAEVIWAIVYGFSPILKSKLRRTIVPPFYGFALAYAFGYEIYSVVIFAVGLILIAFYEFIVPIFIVKGGTYEQKLETVQHEDFKYDSAHDVFSQKYGHELHGLLFTSANISILALFLGSVWASTNNDYIVSTTQDKIVLKIYDKQYLTTGFDAESGTYNREFQLVSFEDFGVFEYLKIRNLLPSDEH
ncbi:hypothetical protein RRM58_004796 [Vibrio harveyi]|nr:hypothetical protein [Vibrio harveyi]